MAPLLRSQGIDFQVAVLSAENKYSFSSGGGAFPTHQLATGRIGLLAAALRIRRLCDELRPDVLHTTLFQSDIAGRFAAIRRPYVVTCSLVGTPYGRDHLLGSGPVSRAKVSGVRTLDALTARRVNLFHAVSSAVASTMAVRLRLPKELIRVVHRGRDMAQLGRRSEGRRQAVRNRLGLAGSDRVVLWAGRLASMKGPDIALQSWHAFRSRGGKGQLWLAGPKGDASSRIQQLIKQLRLSSSVRLLGERDDLADFMVASDALLHTSRREGLPGVLLEAMALELPIVANDLPATRELVAPGIHALVGSVSDPKWISEALMETLDQRHSVRERTAAAYARFVERFRLQASVQGMIDFFREAAGETDRGDLGETREVQ